MRPAERLYRMALRALPRGARATDAEDMAATFRRLAERARHKGFWTLAGLTVAEVANVLAYGLRARADAVVAGLPSPGASARGLVRRRTYATAVVGTLALGVGASTAVVSVVGTVVLRDLPLPEADRLVHAMSVAPGGSRGEATFGVDPASFLIWRDLDDLFAAVEGFHRDTRVITDELGPPEQLQAAVVTPGLFELLGIQPVLGRTFREPEGRPGDQQYVIMGAELWARRFGADPDVIGRRLTLNGQPLTVVGVLPARFGFPQPETQVWMPVASAASALMPVDGGQQVPALDVIARLREGLTLDEAGALVESRTDALAAAGADRVPVLFDMEFFATAEGTRRILLITGGAVLLLLLIAAGNVVSLGLSQAFDRRQELAMRSALGAGRGRLFGESLSENAVLALAGSSLGLLSALLLLDLLLPRLPAQLEINTWGRALTIWPHGVMFALAASAVTAGVVTVLTHLRTGRRTGAASLAKGVSDAPESLRAQQMLLTGQMALAVILLAGTVLMGATVRQLYRVDTGYDADRVLVASVRIPTDEMMRQVGDGSPDARALYMDARFRELEEALARVEGVRGLAVTTSPLPLTRQQFRPALETPEGLVATAADDESLSMQQRAGAMFLPVSDVTPGFFETAGVTLLEGRGFTEADDPSATAVVNDVLARRMWPDERAVGRQFRLREGDAWRTVVGVAAPTTQTDLRDRMGDGAEMYQPLDRDRFGVYRTFVIRTDGDPRTLVDPVRRAIWAVDATQPIERLLPLSDAFGDTVQRERFLFLLLACFALVATALAATGIYALLSRSLARRTRELGIRVALGARPGQVLGRLARSGLLPAAAGVAAGLLAAWYLTRLLDAVLFGVRPGDPVALAASSAVLLAVALAAGLGPARRALGVDVVGAISAE